MAIKFFDMFAGIGGFRSGLEAIGGFECIGYCEIDKYAKQAYEEFNRQITQYVDPETQEILFTQKTAYSNDFGEHGSAAASSLMNTLRQFQEDDIAIGYASVASSSIYEGEYTL